MGEEDKKHCMPIWSGRSSHRSSDFHCPTLFESFCTVFYFGIKQFFLSTSSKCFHVHVIPAVVSGFLALAVAPPRSPEGNPSGQSCQLKILHMGLWSVFQDINFQTSSSPAALQCYQVTLKSPKGPKTLILSGDKNWQTTFYSPQYFTDLFQQQKVL